MKCPMKFNNPCCDADEKCEGAECMWFMRLGPDKHACAIAVTPISRYLKGLVGISTYEEEQGGGPRCPDSE